MVPTYPSLSPPANEMLGGKLNTGKVISYAGPDRECRQQAFNNETGQMTKPSPCDLSTLDSNAAPASSNPISRLDAISKAFSGRLAWDPISIRTAPRQAAPGRAAMNGAAGVPAFGFHPSREDTPQRTVPRPWG
jgi:hypothetical protein